MQRIGNQLVSQGEPLTTTLASRQQCWGTALTSGGPSLKDVTLRMVVQPTVGGSLPRITLSNRFSDQPLVLWSVTIATQAHGLNAADPPRTFTFGGAEKITIPPGAEVASDPCDFSVFAGRNVLLSIAVIGEIRESTTHHLAWTTSGIAQGIHATAGDAAAFGEGPASYFFIKGLDVEGQTARPVLVALGDSITDGFGSSPELFESWPSQLARVFEGQVAVVNAGISSNRLVSPVPSVNMPAGEPAVARFAYDCAPRHGATAIFLMEGINDVADDVSCDQLISGYRSVIAQSRAAGLQVFAGTMTPFKGVSNYTVAREEVRLAANRWILESGEFDAVTDFSTAVADPADPLALLPMHDSGDHLHLSDAGYRVMAHEVARLLNEAWGDEMSLPAPSLASMTR